jgi:hypothetical protein
VNDILYGLHVSLCEGWVSIFKESLNTIHDVFFHLALYRVGHSFDKRLKQKKLPLKCGTWNVRNMYRASLLRTVAEEISKYKIDLVGVQVVKWVRGGTEPAGEYTFFM